MEHHLGRAAGQKHLHGGMMLRPIWQRIDDTRHLLIHPRPILHGRPPHPGVISDRAQMHDQIGGSADGRVHHQSVANGSVGNDVLHGDAALDHLQHGARRTPRHVEPNRMAGGREGGMGERHAQGFTNHLRGAGGSQELAASAGRSTGAATQVRSLLEGNDVVRKARADGLDGARVLAILGDQSYAARHQHAGQIVHGGQGHHHGR